MTADFDTIYAEFDASLRRFIFNRVSDADITEDILQEVYLKIHQRRDTLRDHRKLRSWIYQITRNTIIDYYRGQKAEEELPETLSLSETFTEMDAATALIPTVREMMSHLSETYRQPLVMAEFQGLKQQEIATRLELSLPGAKSRVQRARQQLKALLLDCCSFELDRLGKIISYHPHCKAATIPAHPGTDQPASREKVSLVMRCASSGCSA